MTTRCIVCPPRGPDDDGHEPDYERGLLCCDRAYLRLSSALNVIPARVDELMGHGFVERDTRAGVRRAVVLGAWSGQPYAVVAPAPADPVANVWPAGPVPGQRGGARVHAAPSSSPPLSLDAVDLTSRVNHAARQLLARGVLGLDDDQVGHLSAATILHGWVRDWAEIRREGEPMPVVREMCRWLFDRLDWACSKHPALDEFAGDLFELQATLDVVTGHLPPRPQQVDRPCPACGKWALSHDRAAELIRCGYCARALTDDEYRDHLEDVIKTNWTVVDPAGTKTWPAPLTPVWVRDDELGAVTLGCVVEGKWRTWGGRELTEVSYWAPVAAPADPGPPKEEPGV